MSEEEKAPKKAARKRVVKKGVRGTRAPRKKTIVKKKEDSAEAPEDSNETISPEEDEMTYQLDSNPSEEPSGEIEVVEDDQPTKPEKEKSKKDRSKKDDSKKKEGQSKSSDDSEEEKSGEEGDERGDGRNRRGRNRRGGNNRDREDSGPKRQPVDKDEAAAKAWEIYQGELEEEGVSLVDPRRAREVARRCLELATVFCEERDRYLGR